MSEQLPKPNPNQKVVLSLGDLQQVLNYLATKPYSEVFTVIETVKKARSLDSVISEQNAAKDAGETTTQTTEA